MLVEPLDLRGEHPSGRERRQIVHREEIHGIGLVARERSAGELAVHARAEALELAARFDARNGTSYVGDQLRERMALIPVEPFELEIEEVETHGVHATRVNVHAATTSHYAERRFFAPMINLK